MRHITFILSSIALIACCNVPNVSLDCDYGRCNNYGDYNGNIGQRVGVELVNDTLQMCVYEPCLPCDAYCIFSQDGRFLQDGHWGCDEVMFANGTYPEGTTCMATEECCMICDSGEGYIYGEYGQAHTSSGFTCENGEFKEITFCDGTSLSAGAAIVSSIIYFIFV